MELEFLHHLITYMRTYMITCSSCRVYIHSEEKDESKTMSSFLGQLYLLYSMDRTESFIDYWEIQIIDDSFSTNGNGSKIDRPEICQGRKRVW